MDLLYFILTAYSLTQLLVYSSIFKTIRPKHHFFHCAMCMGFWVGVFLFGINGFTELFTFDYNIANFFILGWLSSGTSYLVNMLVKDEGIRCGHVHRIIQ